MPLPEDPKHPLNQLQQSDNVGQGIAPTIQQQSQVPQAQEKSNKIDIKQIDKDELSTYILALLSNDKADKDEGLFRESREYDIRAYFGLKHPTTFPWPNASNFSVPLVPTLIDTAQANIVGSIYADPQNTVEVDGVGPEDDKKAKDIKSWLNWQMYTEIDSFDVMDRMVFLSLLQGTGIIKCYQSVWDKKVKIEAIPMESIYLPLDAKGMQPDDTDHVIQIVAWDDNDKEKRKGLKFFEGIDDIPKGFSISKSSLSEQLVLVRDRTAGSKLNDRQKRDYYFVAECYLTYFWKSKDAPIEEPKQPIELIVWLAPNGGQILAMVENPFKKRPFVEYKPYPREDRFWGMSLPEKIRQIQEELDYSHNQNINAADMAILPTLFYREGSDFEPESMVRTPGGAVAVPDPSDMILQTVTVNPIFERQEEKYWDLATRLLGLTDLFQGKIPNRKQTATLTKISDARSEIRFKNIYQRYENSWDRMIDLIYYYDNIFFDDIKDKMIKVIGVSEQFKSVKSLFPKGFEGNYNFKFSSSPLTEKQYRRDNAIRFYETVVHSKLVDNNPANMWRLTKKYAEAMGEMDLEELITKPREVNIPSPEEAIMRIMGGETNFVPHPAIDADAYWWALMLFFKTDTFLQSDNETKTAFQQLLNRVINIRVGQVQQHLDMTQIKESAQAQAQARAAIPGGNGNGQRNQNPVG